MKMELENISPSVNTTVEKKSIIPIPVGYKIDQPTELSLEDWQNELYQFAVHYNSSPQELVQSAHLTYAAGRGIQKKFSSPDLAPIPSITVYDVRSPGTIKNFFSVQEWSIFFHARWLAKRGQLPNEEKTFFTEQTNEILFVGTPSAYATLLAMEEAQHALDFLKHTIPEVSDGMQLRNNELVEHDSKPEELRALRINLQDMKEMSGIFSPNSLHSIENRIHQAEYHLSKPNFFFPNLFQKI